MKAHVSYKQFVTVTTTAGRKTITVNHRFEQVQPMSQAGRRANYCAQNGGHPLTVRQERAIRKAEKRSMTRLAGA